MTSAWRGIAITAALVAALAAAAPAWAENARLEVAGEAPAGAEDARARALDAAFAEAVSQAVARLVDAQVQRRRSEDIAAATVRRARRFVRSYRVLDERTAGERVQVRISAQVDMDGLRAALAELGIEAAGASPADPAPRGAPGALLLLRAHVAGAEADGGSGGASPALERLLHELGFALRRVDAGVELVEGARDRAAALPWSDGEATELARAEGAACVIVASLDLGPVVRVRGTLLHGVAGRGRIRVLDVRSGVAEVVAEADATGGGFADAPVAALAQAQAALGQRLAGAVSELVAGHFRPAVAADDALLVEVRGHTRWQEVDAIINHLARTSGIQRVWPRRVGSALILAVDADVDGERAQRRVTSILERLSLPEAAIAVERTRQGLRLTLTPRAESAP